MRYKFILLLIIFLIFVPITITVLPGNAMTVIGEQTQEDKDLDALAWKLAACESSQVPDIKILDKNNEYSYGFLQVQQKTWDWGCKRFNLECTDIFDYVQQRELFKAFHRSGEWQKHWVICSQRIK